MRVITGTARGRKLREPEGMASRPTTDNVKESMFNLIQFDIEGRRVLDLFAGTGQLGIEALSRGASRAMFVDERAEALFQRLVFGNGQPELADERRALEHRALHAAQHLAAAVGGQLADGCTAFGLVGTEYAHRRAGGAGAVRADSADQRDSIGGLRAMPVFPFYEVWTAPRARTAV